MRYRKIIFILILILVILLQTGTILARSPHSREERTFVHRQKRAINEAEEFFLKGDYRSVIKACDDIIYLNRRYPSQKRYMDKLYYLGGVAYLRLNDTSKAKGYLNKIILGYKSSGLLADAYVALAEAYFADTEYSEAANLLIYYVRTYPTHWSIPQAYLKLGQIAQKSGRWEEAKFYFGKIKKDFPLSFEAQLMPSVSGDEDFFFTIQLGSFNSLENARNLKKELEKKGYAPYIVEVRSSKSTFYRVRIGKFESKTEVKHLADKLRKQGFTTKIYP